MYIQPSGWDALMSKCGDLNCSLCCHNREIFLTQDDVDRLCYMGHYEQTFAVPSRYGGNLRELCFIDGDCIFLRNGICSVYENRPTSCRIFPYTLTEHGEGIDHNCPHHREFEMEQNFVSNGKAGLQRIIRDIEKSLQFAEAQD